MKRIISAAATLAVAAGIVVAIPDLAFAHTAKPDDDCETGVTLTAIRYDSDARNTYAITVNGVVTSGQFGSSITKSVPVPQGGVTSTWSIKVDAPGTQYDFYWSGTVGPCGEAPPPPPVVPPTPPTPPVTVIPGPPTKHARVHVTKGDHCNCYRDWVRFHGDRSKVKIRVEHPSKLLWVAIVTGRTVDGVSYLLPNRIDGNSGWATQQVYRERTTNKPCPCHERGDCPVGYTPPSPPCRGRDC